VAQALIPSTEPSHHRPWEAILRWGTTSSIPHLRVQALLSHHAASRRASTPANMMAGFTLLAVSGDRDVDSSCFAAPSCRWGDYAGASPDPVLPNVVWGSGQIVGPSGAIVNGAPNWETGNFALTTAIGGQFNALPPARILDTRDGTGGVPVAPLGPGQTLNVQVDGRGGVPASDVSAVMMNVRVRSALTGPSLVVHPQVAWNTQKTETIGAVRLATSLLSGDVGSSSRWRVAALY